MPWWELALRSDNSPVSWLSSALLFASSVLALQAGVQDKIRAGLASWLAIALLALSLDEQFQYHEAWKYHCAEWTRWCGEPVSGHVDWLGDLPMALVGGIGMITIAKLYRVISDATVRKLLLSAIIVGVILALGTHYGHAYNTFPAWLSNLEEVFEVISETLFLCAMIEINSQRDQD